jgi:hypothetical protein
MRITSVFAIVVIGASGVATAEPRREENTARLRYGADGEAPPDAPQVGEWTQLASPTPAKHGTEFVFVGKDQGTFAKLRIDAERGRLIVRRVKIYLDNGKQQVVNVDSVLGGKQKSATIDLKTPGPIDRIVITTEPQGNGTYGVYGSSGVGVATR